MNDGEEVMKSVMQAKKQCFICGTTLNLHDHHCWHGTANRKKAEKYGLKVFLCQEHHTGGSGVHFNKVMDEGLKKLAQKKFEELYGSREDFIREFGKSVL